MQDNIKVKGSLKIVHLNEQNQIKDVREIPNLVVTVGKGYIANRMTSNATVIMSHMAAGSQNTAPVASETALGSELGRVALDSTTANANTVSYVATFPAGTATGSLTEAGVFNDATTGDMLCRTQFNEINKSASDAIVITWTININ